MRKPTIIIIGGGASGMMAAISAARQGAHVTILERQNKLGRKLLSTGNGRCNFTNLTPGFEHYHSDDHHFFVPALTDFTAIDTIQFMNDIGVLSKNRSFFDEEGYMYPYSDQAKAVVENLSLELKRLNVLVVIEAFITKTPYYAQNIRQYCVETDQAVYHSDCLILANGSKATEKLGSNDSGYMYAKAFGHKIRPIAPSLVGICCKESYLNTLSGIRIVSRVSLFINSESNVEIANAYGELQMTKYGISGIPAFQISRYIAECKPITNAYIIIDYMPDYKKPQLLDLLRKRLGNQQHKNIAHFLIGLFPEALSQVLIQITYLRPNDLVSTITEEQLYQLVHNIKHFRLTVSGTKGFDQAQVCRGGVDTREMNPYTLESKLSTGLYIVGELLDVDGDCGGYNLQWAWTSGAIAGKHAALAVIR